MRYCLLVVLLAVPTLAAQDGPAKRQTGFVNKTFKDGDKEIPYVVFVPKDYDGTKPYPVILYLHGFGDKQAVPWGLGTYIKARIKAGQDFDFICVFPHSEREWDRAEPGKEAAIRALDAVLAEYKVDLKRVSLTGFSMGGTGTWSLGARYPDRWAALIPVASGSTPEWAVKVKDVPIWAFEGSEDKEGDVQVGRLAVDFVRKAGGKPLYTEFKGIGHEPDHAYYNDDLYAWLRKQSRKKLASPGELDNRGWVKFDGKWQGSWQNSLERGWGTATVILRESEDGLLSGTDDNAKVKGQRTGVDTFTFEEQVEERRYRMVGRVVGNTMYLDYAVTPLKGGAKYYGVYVLKRLK